MALWQYSFLILPESCSEKDINTKDRAEFEDYVIWLDENIKTDYFSQIKEILPKRSSWSESIIQYGDLESNCFEISINKDKYVDSVSFRVDFRNDYKDFLQSLLNFLKEKNLRLLDEQSNIVDLNYKKVDHIIKDSRQAKIMSRFCNGNGFFMKVNFIALVNSGIFGDLSLQSSSKDVEVHLGASEGTATFKNFTIWKYGILEITFNKNNQIKMIGIHFDKRNNVEKYITWDGFNPEETEILDKFLEYVTKQQIEHSILDDLTFDGQKTLQVGNFGVKVVFEDKKLQKIFLDRGLK